MQPSRQPPQIAIATSAKPLAAMDETLPKPPPIWRRKLVIVGVVALLLIGGAIAAGVGRSSFSSLTAQSVAADRITMSTVATGLFEDFIAVRGAVTPLNSVVLDSLEGGRVERKLIEDGALVKAGQAIAELSNSSLQLEMLRSEAEVSNQLNAMRSLELQLERTRADNERQFVETRWQMKRTEQKRARDEGLADRGFIAPAALHDSRDEAEYWKTRLANLEGTQRRDNELQSSQLVQLRASAKQLQANLTIARSKLESLVVRAPVEGRLTSFEVTVGQSLGRGQRIGQIDSQDASKFLVSVDEHYLPRVTVGQSAVVEHDGKQYELTVRAVNPQVRGGQFSAELVFAAKAPDGLRRGQTLNIKLRLGESKQGLLLPIGPFITESPNAVFVLDASRKLATKRNVTLGRRNVSQVEVLSGLSANDRVITSSYAAFVQQDRIAIE